MTKKELIDKVAEKTALNKTTVNSALDGIFEVLKGSLAEGDRITMLGFGTFSVAERAQRKGRNPRTGEEITIPAKKVAKFKASSNLTAAINGK